jgi:predicted methyltransferase
MKDVETGAVERPTANHSIEQFLMTPESLQVQVRKVGPFLAEKRVFFLGDDDHVSPLLARDYGVRPVVYEIDERVRTSLATQFSKYQIIDVMVADYDARSPVAIGELCEAFYINPPYSSKSEGLGIKVWLMRALEACQGESVGVLVMPWTGGNVSASWVSDVQESVQSFLAHNGLSISAIDHNVSSYEDVNDTGLLSSNIYLERVNPQLRETVDVGELYN